MIEPAVPVDESKRLQILKSLNLLGSSRDETFDRITRIAKRTLDTNISLVSLIDSDRQWFKSEIGLKKQETQRAISFCGHAILSDELMVVEDALLDPRFSDNPLVSNSPFIRFYAGCPIRYKDGTRLGTLCVIDSMPRKLSDDDR